MSDQPATRASGMDARLVWDTNTAAALFVLLALAFLITLRLGIGPVTILTR